jgi:hypothetical protein
MAKLISGQDILKALTSEERQKIATPARFEVHFGSYGQGYVRMNGEVLPATRAVRIETEFGTSSLVIIEFLASEITTDTSEQKAE